MPRARSLRWPRPLRPWRRLGALAGALGLAAGLLLGCAGARPPVDAALAQAARDDDALRVYDALEALIAAGRDTLADRQYAYDRVRRHEEDTAAYTFARAAVTGRLVQDLGLRGAGLVHDVERYARRSRELDPDFRDGAATRLLGTLYVIAPARLLEHGDSEEGLAMLQELVERRPDVVENHLRLAEAYVALGDPIPAVPHLCACLSAESLLRRDDRELLVELLGRGSRLRCTTAASLGPR
jgi:tetratricopeptide (TPR) repeat protein